MSDFGVANTSNANPSGVKAGDVNAARRVLKG